MSQYYPPPPGVGSGRSQASRYGQPPPPPDNYRPPPPPSFVPPPPPSRSNNYDSYAPNRYSDREDRYGRNDRGDRGDRYQPSRRNDNYVPQQPDRSQSSYHEFRGGDSFRPPQSDFSFRSEKPMGVGDSYNNYRPQGSSAQRAAPRGPARSQYRDRPYRPGGNFRGRGGYEARRVWKPFKPAERAILTNTDNDKPAEDYADSENGVVYKAIDQLSDSDEADMDISDSDNESGEPTAKRARTTAQTAAADSVPKWSNPDPYTALPPIDTTDKKRKDMVQLIRKARVEPAGGARTSLPADDEDFIRIGSDSDDEEGEDSDAEFIDPLTYKRDIAPTGAVGPSNGAWDAPLQVNSATDLTARVTSLDTFVPRPAPNALHGPSQVSSQPPQAANNGKKRPAGDVDLTKSSDLGSRKRTYDDVLKLPSHAKLKPASKQPVGGNMISEWQPKTGEPRCPWVRSATCSAPANVKLHMEIRDFYDHVKPCQFEDRLRSKLVDDLNSLLLKRGTWRERKLFPFGSFMSGLYLPTGDMDLAFCSVAFVNGAPAKPFGANQHNVFTSFLRNNHLAVGNKIDSIKRAKVPLAKYVDRTTGLKIDISFENVSGIIAINTFKAWKAQYPVMPILVTVIKQFLLMRGLNEPVNGGIGGFSVICMVVSMLQMMPEVQSGDMIPEHHLGSLLMHFFDLYGNRFDYKTTGLRLNPPGYINKNDVNLTYNNPSRPRLCIIDPNNPDNDIAGGSSNYPQIVVCFSRAHTLLRERLLRISRGENFDSVLDVILGGDYSQFREQRNHLRKLHERIFGDYGDESAS